MTYFFAQLCLQRSHLRFGEEPIGDQLALKHRNRIARIHCLELIGRTIHSLVIGAGVIRKALDIAPNKRRTTARACLLDRHTPGRCNRLDIATVDPQPLTLIENTQRQRIRAGGRCTDRDTIIVHHKNNRQLSLFGKAHRLVKIALSRRSLAQ